MSKMKKMNRAEFQVMLSEEEVTALLEKIDEGYQPTGEEIEALGKVEKITLKKLPGSIFLLKGLVILDLHNAQGSSLEGIKVLQHLQSISISNTQVSSLTELGGLTELWLLDASNTQISSLEGIEELQNLGTLDLSGTQISSLEGIDRLQNLSALYLRNTPISSLEGLKQLRHLEYLSISGTNVQSLAEVGELRELMYLDLNRTSIAAAELAKLQNLKKLKRLDLDFMQIRRLPEELLKLNLPFFTSRGDLYLKEGIFLIGTELVEQPLSLFEQERSLIEEYYAAEQVSISEAKVIFLGNGEVGKTYTIERILRGGEPGDYHTDQTPGISIRILPEEISGADCNIRIWDFGGQEIMHAMHRCFLTSRTCYVIMVTYRQGDITEQARYWLKNVESFAPGSPVILMENRWGEDRVGAGLNSNQLQKEFPNIREVVSVSSKCDDKEAFNNITRAILRQARELDSSKMRFPKKWAQIRKELLDLAAEGRHYIEKEEYRKLCVTCGESSQAIGAWLLQWFNDLGVCFSYHQDKETGEELERYKVLVPEWLTNAIYIIINQGKSDRGNGVIGRQLIRYLLTDEKILQDRTKSLLPGADYRDTEEYILEVMRKFRISYKISDEEEFIPALCRNQTPENLHPADCHRHLTYHIVYSFLPDTVVHQMMIHWHGQLNMQKIWQKGLQIDIPTTGTSAVVDMSSGDNILKIDVYAGGEIPPCYLLEDIRKNLYDINRRLGLQPEREELVSQKDSITGRIPMQILFRMKEQGKKTVPLYDNVGYAEFDVDELLGYVINKGKLDLAKQEAEEQNQPLGRVLEIHFHNCDFYFARTAKNTRDLLQTICRHQEKVTDELAEKLTALFAQQQDERIQRLAAELKKEKKKSPGERFRDALGDSANLVTFGTALAPLMPQIGQILKTAAPELLRAFLDGMNQIFPMVV